MDKILALLLALLLASPAWGAPAFVQENHADAGFTASAALAFSSNNTAGNLIVVCTAINGGGINPSITSIVDTALNTYTVATDANNGGNDPGVSVYYAKNIAGGANTVTVTPNAAANIRWGIVEYSGLDTSAPLDQTTSTFGTSTSPDSGSVTTTQASELLVGCIGALSGGGAFTNGASYTTRFVVTVGGDDRDSLEDRNVSSTGSYSAGGTLATSATWGAIIGTFKASGAAPSVPSPPTRTLLGVGQ